MFVISRDLLWMCVVVCSWVIPGHRARWNTEWRWIDGESEEKSEGRVGGKSRVVVAHGGSLESRGQLGLVSVVWESRDDFLCREWIWKKKFFGEISLKKVFG